MWCSRVPIGKLIEASAWRVEFFCGEPAQSLSTSFPMASVGDLVRERRESVEPSVQPENMFNYVGLENIESHTGRLTGFEPRVGADIRSRSKVFRPGDVLYGRLRAYLNKVYLADSPVDSGVCSTEFFVFIPDRSRVVPGYLRFILSSDYVLQRIACLQTGSALPRVHLSDIVKIPVPLPPLDTQHAIVIFLNIQAQRRDRLLGELAEIPRTTRQHVMRVLESGECDLEKA